MITEFEEERLIHIEFRRDRVCRKAADNRGPLHGLVKPWTWTWRGGESEEDRFTEFVEQKMKRAVRNGDSLTPEEIRAVMEAQVETQFAYWNSRQPAELPPAKAPPAWLRLQSPSPPVANAAKAPPPPKAPPPYYVTPRAINAKDLVMMY